MTLEQCTKKELIQIINKLTYCLLTDGEIKLNCCFDEIKDNREYIKTMQSDLNSRRV